MTTFVSPWLSPDQFSQAYAALPLVSLNFGLTRPGTVGPELLLDQAARNESVHAYLRVYAQWLLARASIR